MKHLLLWSVLSCVGMGCGYVDHLGDPPGETRQPDPAALVGNWQVDLRPTPDAEAYFAPFEVTAAAAGSLEGSFYGSPIREGQVNTDWGALHFAFVTDDGSGSYHTSGRLEGGVLRGTTHSLARDFLSVWSAVPRP